MKCMWKRGCLASQSLTAGVLWVDRLSQTRCTASSARYGLVDRAQEFLELDRPMLGVELRNHGAVGDVERREQVDHAVTGVIVGAALGHTRYHRQHRLGPIQRLHLTLFVDAEHHRFLWRIVVEPNNIDDLGHELRIRRELEPID